ncbi:MAG: helix-turn-helix domain-containing protein [Ruminococcus flavefaciens]|nr:helix-turn-helix domain-containing protein [Ruminococcus flavefaciens]
MNIDREKISYIIGQRIYDFRTQKKLSQEALAFESEIHPAYLGRVERGEKCPTVETLYKISKGLKIPLSELLDVSSEVKPTNTEAMHRIQTAMQCLSDEEAVEAAEILEKIIAFKYNKQID